MEDKIIDIDASLETVVDMSLLKEIFAMLAESILRDKEALQAYYLRNDIEATSNLLLRLDGTFRSCVVPRLQRVRGQLYVAIKQSRSLATTTPLHQAFYKEINIFLSEYERLNQSGVL